MALALLLQILAAVSFSKRTVRITPAAHKSQPDRYCSSFANYSVILPTAGARTDTSTFCLDSDNLLDTASTTLFCRVSGVPSKMDSGIWGTASVIARHAESNEEGDGDGVRNGDGNGARITTRERVAKSRTRAKMVRMRERMGRTAGRTVNEGDGEGKGHEDDSGDEYGGTAAERPESECLHLLVILVLGECQGRKRRRCDGECKVT